MRVVVVGTSGAGKSTFAAALARTLQTRHIELDQLFWGPHWQPVAAQQFAEATAQAAQGAAWVADGNYSAVREQLWPRATHIVWLNYGRRTVFSRVLWRTIHRAALGSELFHGNRETWSKAFLSRDSIVLWSLQTFAKNRRKYRSLRDSGQYPHLQWLEFQRPQQARQWLESMQQDRTAQR